MNDKMREEFEAWYAHQAGCDIRKLEECRWGSKGYRDPFAANAWFAWKASRAALVVELPELVDGFLYGRAWNSAIGRCKGLIEAAGVRVAP